MKFRQANKILRRYAKIAAESQTERLNNNEVKEVARMQQLITKYENVINVLFILAKHGKELPLLKTCDSHVDNAIVFLWKWIKEQKELNNKWRNIQ